MSQKVQDMGIARSRLLWWFGSYLRRSSRRGKKRAKELRKVCSEQRIPMDDVAKAIEHFLKSKKVGDALIQEQVERARKFLKLS